MSEPPAKNFWNRLSNLALVRFLLFFASGWALVQLLAYFEGVVVIFSFAAIIAFLLSYPVKWLRRFLPHGVAASFVFLLSLVIIVAFTATVGLTILSQGQQLVDKS
ncbi:MAG TPA: AI-2E family transporter, partial [Cyanobacteria bacterium UBA11369]|nr:AI-2E family transporter [Cyanobacteria bacterium UBA11369]